MTHSVTDDLDLLLAVMPPPLADSLRGRHDLAHLVEIVLDLGRPPEARFPDRGEDLSSEPVLRSDLDHVSARVGRFGKDNRAGIERTLHRVSAIRNRSGDTVGMTCRVGRAVYGTVDILRDVIERGASILLLGRPGVGKTTLLREAARVLADELSKRVVIVDTSNEIAGDGDIPHPGIGRARRMQVPSPEAQADVMIEAVENHMPEVIVIDEIGTSAEAAAARTIAERGVQLIATAHGNTLENLLQNPTLSDLVGGIQTVTLSDEEARRRRTQKSVLERKAPPTFDVLIEIEAKDALAVHRDVAEVVDRFLRGFAPRPERRRRRDDGEVEIESRGEGAAGRRPTAEGEPAGAERGGAVERGGMDRGAVGRGRVGRGTVEHGGLEHGGLETGWVESGGAERGAIEGGAMERAVEGAAMQRRGEGGERWRAEARPGERGRRHPTQPPGDAPRPAPLPGERWEPPGRRRGGGAAEAARGYQPPWPPVEAAATASSRDASAATDRPADPPPGRAAAAEVHLEAGEPVAAAHPRWPGSTPGGRVGRLLRIYPYAVSRSRLERAIKKYGAPGFVCEDLSQADVIVTTKSQERRQPRKLRDAQARGVPLHLVRGNTVTQLEGFVRSVFDLRQANGDEAAALEEAEQAVEAVLESHRPVELAPRERTLRRLQHELAERHRLVTESRGDEPYRRVVVYPP
jgi:stage III sporulation protein SpoIIIAA